jgi:predicted MFS family arabinose efflux permease
MNNKSSIITKLAFLSVSFMVTSAYAIQGSLPQLKAALNVTQTQSEYLVTTPSFAVMIFVVLSPLLQEWFHISDKKIIMMGLRLSTLRGLSRCLLTTTPRF